jgi:hypothetical protein
MSEVWLVLGICLVLVLGAAIPLIRDRGAAKRPLIPRKETLRDWRQKN